MKKSTPKYHIINANQAVARIAYKTNEVIPIYPITPASEMSELAEQWSATNKTNILGSVPSVFQMQSEAGVAGAMHGALQTGSLSTTFTSSQGLLLMLPNMYKIAGELTPNVIHVATRSIATHALSVFGDHSDVMAIRQSGYAMLASASVQEAQDFALISQVASLQSKIPFIHFFDGFRTSHEVSKIQSISDTDIEKITDFESITTHRNRALNPNNPVIRGTAQGPDVFFQSREATNALYTECPDILQSVMNTFGNITGRAYQLFEYFGHPKAEHIIISMASSVETAEKAIVQLNNEGGRYGLIKVRLFRPFSTKHLINVLPKTCKSIAVLDRTKEPGSIAEPLCLDVNQSIMEAYQNNELNYLPRIIGGRYGLSSKEFTPSMVQAIFNNLKSEEPKKKFTVGIKDDVTRLSLNISRALKINESSYQVLFYQEKNTKNEHSFVEITKHIGSHDETFVQAYNEINYKKSNTACIAHLRIDNQQIKAPYLIEQADFIACDSVDYLTEHSVIDKLKSGGTLFINANLEPLEFWNSLSSNEQYQLIEKDILLLIANLNIISKPYLEEDNPISSIHNAFLAIENKFYSNKLIEVKKLIKEVEKSGYDKITIAPNYSEEFNQTLLGQLLANNGNNIPVSQLPLDGTFTTNTSQFNKPNTQAILPEWSTDLCTQCGACSMACPQGALRIKVYDDSNLSDETTLKYMPSFDFDLMNYTIQINPDQCNGCNNCVDACPVKALQMTENKTILNKEKHNWKQFNAIPEFDRTKIDTSKVRQQQLQEPLFKYSSGVEGCGEAPYLKLLSQLYGDRLLVANATGASSIFGGALPTTPWSKNSDGRGPAWSNSLFEDNAEFGLGFRLSLNHQQERAKKLLEDLLPSLDFDLVYDILNSDQNTELDITEQRDRIEILKNNLKRINSEKAQILYNSADSLVKKSVWIVGGDGWAYDIGFGGLDHVLTSGENVNILVLDNEVYDNTGGQTSKATPFGAQAKFSFNGKKKQKKDLGKFAISYDNVYVASVAIGADQDQTLKVFNEAESFDGPSIIIAYCHSNAHGINMKTPSLYHQAAVNSGQWLLYRHDPRKKNTTSFQLDSETPSIPIQEYLNLEKRFSKLSRSNFSNFNYQLSCIQNEILNRYESYKKEQTNAIRKNSLITKKITF